MICNPRILQVPQLRRLWQLAFGDEEGFITCFFENGFSPDRCRCILQEETVAAALYWFDGECGGQKIAYLYGVATHPDYRGQGLCRQLMEDTQNHLAALGYSSILLVPQKESLREMYRKLGYRDCTGISEFLCSDDPYPVPIHAIDREEYAALRRQLLPKNSVVQEGENLVFLSAYARFYKGMDFLLAAAVEGDTLFGIELLGNPGAAPGILCALGYPQGTFRTPGTKRPFAMFRPLETNAVVPAYFAFAFD